jgi:hypothetical protein
MTLPTLTRLLSSQEARDAAPCVAVTGDRYLYRNGYLLPKGATKQHAISAGNPEWDCIWSGDLPALLAEMVAEIDRLNGLMAILETLEWRNVPFRKVVELAEKMQKEKTNDR